MKLEVLLNRATSILRQLFLTRWRLTHQGKDWVNDNKTGHDFVTGIGKDIADEANGQEKRLLQNGDVNQWDLTILAHVLRHTQFPRVANQSAKYELQFEKENDKIWRLITFRNHIAHHPTKKILNVEFHNLWNSVAEVLVNLGDSANELNELKDCSLQEMLKNIDDVQDTFSYASTSTKSKKKSKVRSSALQASSTRTNTFQESSIRVYSQNEPSTSTANSFWGTNVNYPLGYQSSTSMRPPPFRPELTISSGSRSSGVANNRRTYSNAVDLETTLLLSSNSRPVTKKFELCCNIL